MDEERHAAWETVLTMLDRNEEAPHARRVALLQKGIFEGLNKVDSMEEAMYVVRYWLHGVDLSPISSRSQAEATNWFAIAKNWGLERQAEKLRAMITASSENPDYWDALNHIAARLHKEREPFPDDLAAWAIEFHQGKIRKPAKQQGNRGEPHYAHDGRNLMLTAVFGLLGYLGLTSRMERYDAIAEECSLEADTVRKVISKGKQFDGSLPAPWEVWPKD